MGIEVREPKTEQELEEYYELRWRVLREPWTQERESGRDEHEHEAVHLGAWAGPKLAGVGRLHLISPGQAQIRYMAVEPEHARHGIGTLILRALEERAAALGAKLVVLSAREKALPFYRKNGYRLVDRSSTLFNSIAHWWMEKSL